MPHVVKRIARSTTAKLNNYAGPAGELFMDTATNDLVLQNGQNGGVRLAKASTTITADNGLSVTAGGTLAATTTVSGVDATTAAKGVVQLSNATDGTSQTMAATPKAVSDALQAAKDYADTAGAPYSGTAPIAVDATNRVISVTDATTSAKGVMQVGDNVSVNNGVVSVKPWAVHSATAAAVDVNDVQEGALIQTDEPVGGDLTAVLANVEQTLSGSSSLVPSSAAVKSAMESLLAPVYVNASTGDDNNDGMTAATAVQTIGRGLVLASQRGNSGTGNNVVILHIAGGTYNEHVQVSGRVRLDAQGPVVINGNLGVAYNGFLHLSGDGFTVVGVNTLEICYAAIGGVFSLGAPLHVQSSAGAGVAHAISADDGGNIYIGSHLTITCPGVTSVLLFARESGVISFVAGGRLTITATSSANTAFGAADGASLNFYNGPTDAFVIEGTYAQAVCFAGANGVVFIDYRFPAFQGTPVGPRYFAQLGGIISVQGQGLYRIPGSQPGTVDAATYGVYA